MLNEVLDASVVLHPGYELFFSSKAACVMMLAQKVEVSSNPKYIVRVNQDFLGSDKI